MNRDRIDEAVLALLYLGIHERDVEMDVARAWKSLDWDIVFRFEDGEPVDVDLVDYH